MISVLGFKVQVKPRMLTRNVSHNITTHPRPFHFERNIDYILYSATDPVQDCVMDLPSDEISHAVPILNFII